MAYNLLKGKRGLIFGALNDKSIAWKVAERAHEEGAQIVLTNTPVSIRMGTIDRLAEQCGAVVIPADATNVADLEHLVTKGMEQLGGRFDFVLHSIGMSPNVRKGRTYDDLDYDYYQKNGRYFGYFVPQGDPDLPQARRHRGVGVGCGALLHCGAADAVRLQRYGRCQGHARVHCPQLRLHLWPREEHPHQYGGRSRRR